jgi:hypothetical protein
MLEAAAVVIIVAGVGGLALRRLLRVARGREPACSCAARGCSSSSMCRSLPSSTAAESRQCPISKVT